MDKFVKLGGVLVVLGIVVQGALYGSAVMDDGAFAAAVLNCLGDNATSQSMEKDIRTVAEQKKITIARPEDVKVTIDCGDGIKAPTNITSRLRSIQVNKACKVTGEVHYTRKVGLLKKPVTVVQSKTFAAGATVSVPGHSSGVQMPGNIPRELPSRPMPDLD